MKRLALALILAPVLLTGCTIRDPQADAHLVEQLMTIRSAATGQSKGATIANTTPAIIRAADAGLKLLGKKYHEP